MDASSDAPPPPTADEANPPGDAAEEALTPPEAEADAPAGDSASAESAPPEDGAGDDAAQDAEEKAAPSKKGRKAKRKPTKPPRPEFDPPPPERLVGAVEALLLAAGDVVRENRLRDLLGLPSVAPLREALEAIDTRWRDAGLAFELERVAKGVRVVTRPEFAEYVGRLKKRPVSDKLTKSQLETLSIVAYKQPVGRAEVERIRGVQAGEALRALLERGLLKVVGRSDQPGRPLLYGTTDTFLTVFGLRDLEDLPSHRDLERM